MLRQPASEFIALRLLVLPMLLLLMAVGCSDSSSTPETGGTGTVSFFVTDAPSDLFDEINVTIDEIVLSGGGPKVTIFEGETTIDLKSLESFSDLLVVAEDVPARAYSKIRLGVTAIELVDYDGDPQVISVDPPGGGKIDLNPRGPFEVKPGGHLVIEIDMDAEKSIHIHETGNGKYKFRPVVFVTIGEGGVPRKLSRVHGYIDRIDDDGRRMLLCSPLSAGPTDRLVNEDRAPFQVQVADVPIPEPYRPMPPAGRCLVVLLDDATAVFDTNGDPVAIEDLGPFPRDGIPVVDPDDLSSAEAGLVYYVDWTDWPVTVIGHFTVVPGTEEDRWAQYPATFWSDSVTHEPPSLMMRAAVIEEGPRGTFLQLRGWLEASDDDPDDVLGFFLAPGQGFGDSTSLPALFQDGTRIFDRAGDEFFVDELEDVAAVEVDGVFGAVDDSGRLFYKTALVVLDDESGGPPDGRFEGIVRSVDLAARTLTVQQPEGPSWSTFGVPEGLEIHFVYEGDDGMVNEQGMLHALAPGTPVDITFDTRAASPIPPVTAIVAFGAPTDATLCRSDADCAGGEYCHRPDDRCDWGGVCEVVPQACTTHYDPVCGCDGVVHSNACAAAGAGTSLQPDREVCTPAG